MFPVVNCTKRHSHSFLDNFAGSNFCDWQRMVFAQGIKFCDSQQVTYHWNYMYYMFVIQR